ncbi:MAG: DUF4124 domain-containing protein [Burkholderiaceae bacterium]|nr:DUF4124 domain-containing protein [Burkholderiaceae bacterium]
MRKPRLPNRPARLLFAVVGLLLAAPVLAGTWQWRDASGRMVYSDQPPPSSVPASRILRAPASAQGAGTQAATPAGAGQTSAAAGQAPAGTGAAAPRSWVEKEQASRKRALEREEVERKQGAEREQAARNARVCEEARTALRTLESGLRMSYVDDKGERQVLDEAERARRAEAARQEIARSCTGAS